MSKVQLRWGVDKNDLPIPPPEQLPPTQPVKDQEVLEIPVPLPPDPREERPKTKKEKKDDRLVPGVTDEVPMVPDHWKKRRSGA